MESNTEYSYGAMLTVFLSVACAIFAAPFLFKLGLGVGSLALTFITDSAMLLGFIHLFSLISVVVAALTLLVSAVKLLTLLVTKIVDDLQSLAQDIRRSAKETALDAGFMAIVALLAAAVAYMTTGDFLEKITTLRVFAVAAILYAVFKCVMLLPVQQAKWAGELLTLVVLFGSIAFLMKRHDLWHPDVIARLVDGAKELELQKQATFGAIAALSAVSLLYPFTASGWRRILGIGS